MSVLEPFERAAETHASLSFSTSSCCSPARGRYRAAGAIRHISGYHRKNNQEVEIHVQPGRRNIGKPVVFFDTTLRDGEQSPGSSLNASEKLEIAHQLVRLGVDVIEAGFPASSPGDFDAVQAIAREVRGAVICGLARCTESDIRTCWDAIKDAERPRIHTFVSTSDIHLEHQMRATSAGGGGADPGDGGAVRSSLCPDDVEFSAMDATRSDVDFLAEVLETAIQAGATTINVPDTVGYTLPTEYAALMDQLYEKVPSLEKVVLSAHCHNDLGVAVGQLAGRGRSGAPPRWRWPSTAWASGPATRRWKRSPWLWSPAATSSSGPCNIVTTEIARASRMVSSFTGHMVQANKADRGQERLRPRIGHPPGRRAQGAHHLRDHARPGHRSERLRHRAGQALGPPRAAVASGRTGHPPGRGRSWTRSSAASR